MSTQDILPPDPRRARHNRAEDPLFKVDTWDRRRDEYLTNAERFEQRDRERAERKRRREEAEALRSRRRRKQPLV